MVLDMKDLRLGLNGDRVVKCGGREERTLRT